MGDWNSATWRNGTKTVTGRWTYYRPSDRFDIVLDSKDPVTGQQRTIQVYGDYPEWDNWKRVKEVKDVSSSK